MRNAPIAVTLLLAFSAVDARSSTTDLSGNPYRQVIVDRNVFGLKPPPPVVDPETLKPPPPKITLVGIVNVFGTRKAVLKSTEVKPASPGQPPQPDDPYVLTEGQSQQGIQVIAIDEKAGTVKVDNNGQVDTLTFDKNGMKVPTGGAVPTPGAAPGAPGAMPRPGMPGGLPMRTGMPMAMPPHPGGGLPTAAPMPVSSLDSITGANATLASATTPLPTRNVRLGQELSAEQSVLMTELERERTRDLVAVGLAPPLPPTPLTSQTDLQTLVLPPVPNSQVGANSSLNPVYPVRRTAYPLPRQ